MEVGKKLWAGWEYRGTDDIWREFQEISKGRPNHLGVDVGEGRRYGRKGVRGVKTKGFDHVPEHGSDFILITGRLLTLWNINTRTRRSWSLRMLTNFSEEDALMSRQDAKELGLSEGDSVVLRSREFSEVVKVNVSECVPRWVILMPFHYGKANSLMDWKVDPTSKEPAFK